MDVNEFKTQLNGYLQLGELLATSAHVAVGVEIAQAIREVVNDTHVVDRIFNAWQRRVGGEAAKAVTP